MHRVSTEQIHVAIDHQDFRHLLLELGIAALQVVADTVWLEFISIEYAPYRCLADLGKPLETGAAGMGADMPGQC
jgi:hypothetical protein